MIITKSIGNRREIWQLSIEIIELIPPDGINKGSVTKRQKKKKTEKVMNDNYRECERVLRNRKFSGVN